MRIAVIGSGISGMAAAYHLSRAHDVTVYESGAHIGGHTNTVDVEYQGREYAIDTGFIVYNDWTYPNFVRLLEELGVPWQPSHMSFSVRCERSGLEYNGTSINSLFAQRRNLARPAFLRMVADILRFNRRAPKLLQAGAAALTLSEYLAREAYSQYFVDHYIIPMGAAIWSSRPVDMLQFPARFFVEFFANHGFLSVDDRPTWRVIRGGSREYVKRLTAPYAKGVQLNTPVASLQRQPRRPLAWAAWNYHLPIDRYGRVTVTYNMNILQTLAAPAQFLLTLNRSDDVDSRKILGRYVYHHPVFTAAAVAAQGRRREINGVRRTYYCGAYWGYGFHEDGVKSALASVEEFRRRQDHEQPHLQRVG